MRIYQSRPSLDVLVAFAFERYPGCGRLRVHLENPAAEFKDFQHEDAARRDPLLNVSLSGLWNTMKAAQEEWQLSHPRESVVLA